MQISKLPEYFFKLIKNPWVSISYLGSKGLLNWMSDELYLKLCFRANMGYKLNLKDPQTFNEKLQWLKLHDRKPEYTQMVDKHAVREYIKNTIGDEYLIPLLGVWDNFDDIDFNTLPDQFVLKCNHDSGTVVICKDKKTFDVDSARKKINARINYNYYNLWREWPYKNVPRKIIAEKYMVDESGTELKDYKFFAFDGKVKALFIATDRPFDTRFDFYDEIFVHLPFTNGHPNADKVLTKPRGFDEMIRLAGELSKGIPHVRVDFYDINGKVYFGELTFFHWSGMVAFDPREWDYTFGSWIKLPPL